MKRNNCLYNICVAMAVLSVMVTLGSCSDVKLNPVTYDDIAATIPAQPEFVASVNVAFESDSALVDVWGKDDVSDLISEGLALDTVRPSHLVVVGMPKATFVTWPLMSPALVAEKVADWPDASLNNTVDAHIKVKGKACLILSSTQAWVVNNVHGEKYVNDLLSGAMSAKASGVLPLLSCINDCPEALTAIVRYAGKFYRVELNHDDGQVRVDVDAYTGNNDRATVVDGLGRLPIEYIDQASPVSPFAAVAVDRGSMPSLIGRLAKLYGSKGAVKEAAALAPLFDDADGTVVARWDEGQLELAVPFINKESAKVAGRRLKELDDETKDALKIVTVGKHLYVSTPFTYYLPPIDRDRSTPHHHSQTEQPAAVAFARMDVGDGVPVEAYFELADTHARFQVDYPEGRDNLARVMKLIKTIAFRTL